MITSELRVGVIGAGVMGTDHIARIMDTTAGATVSAIVEPDEHRAREAAVRAPGSKIFARIEDALEEGAVDAVVVAVPGSFHEAVLLPALEANVPILCEKPLTEDPASSLRIAEAEQKGGRQLIQVGFMRRFDAQYRELHDLITAGAAGDLLMLHGVHRNPSVPPSYTQEMLITDSIVHEFDVIPWLAGGTIQSVEVHYGKHNSLSPSRLREPILVLMEMDNGVLGDVEMNVSIQFGYQVATEAVFEQGVVRIGQPSGLQLWQDQRFQIVEHVSFKTRFKEAYDAEVQAWVDAARRGTLTGPSTWDGYRAAVACAAGVKALQAPGPVVLNLAETPAFYAGNPEPVIV